MLVKYDKEIEDITNQSNKGGQIMKELLITLISYLSCSMISVILRVGGRDNWFTFINGMSDSLASIVVGSGFALWMVTSLVAIFGVYIITIWWAFYGSSKFIKRKINFIHYLISWVLIYSAYQLSQIIIEIFY